MFSGLVEGRAKVLSFRAAARGATLELARPELARGLPAWRPVRGESIALSGCCLTVVRVARAGRTVYDLSRETLDCTWLGALAPGRVLNVERALRLGDRLGGHLVAGHVDAVGAVAAIEDSRDGGRLFTFRAPRGFERWLLAKGSVTVDGISLTVVAPRAGRFRVAVIPETLRRTTLGAAAPGDPVHLEGDLIGKWVSGLVPGALRRRRTARS